MPPSITIPSIWAKDYPDRLKSLKGSLHYDPTSMSRKIF